MNTVDQLILGEANSACIGRLNLESHENYRICLFDFPKIHLNNSTKKRIPDEKSLLAQAEKHYKNIPVNKICTQILCILSCVNAISVFPFIFFPSNLSCSIRYLFVFSFWRILNIHSLLMPSME